MARVAVIAALVLTAMCGVAFGLPKKVVYRRRAECGNNQLAFVDASKACEVEGGRLATKAELNKFITKFNLRECGPGACGWLRGERTFKVPCEDDTLAKKCEAPDSGADAWCFGAPPSTRQEDQECVQESSTNPPPEETNPPPSSNLPAPDTTRRSRVIINHRLSLKEYTIYTGRDCSKEYSSWQQKDVSRTEPAPEDCLDHCNNNPECEGFTYETKTALCETFTYICPKFSDVSGTKPRIKFYVKPRHNNGLKNIYSAWYGKACTPLAVTREGEQEAKGWGKEQDCAKQCAAVPDCTGFNFQIREHPSLAKLEPSQEAHLLEFWFHFKAPRGYCILRNGTAPNCDTIEEMDLWNYYEKL